MISTLFNSFCFFIIFCFVSVCASFASDYTTSQIHLAWDYDPPPDLLRYEIKCTPDDSDLIKVKLDEVKPLSDGSWEWQGLIKHTAGKYECRVQAVDLAEQKSGWSEPAVRDELPPIIIKLRVIVQGAEVHIKGE